MFSSSIYIEKDTFLGRSPGEVVEGCPGPREPEKEKEKTKLKLWADSKEEFCKNSSCSLVHQQSIHFYFHFCQKIDT